MSQEKYGFSDTSQFRKYVCIKNIMNNLALKCFLFEFKRTCYGRLTKGYLVKSDGFPLHLCVKTLTL